MRVADALVLYYSLWLLNIYINIIFAKFYLATDNARAT